MIELRNVSKTYCTGIVNKKDIFTIKDINMTVPKGRTTALLGRSGCGKSTIANMIAGILNPTSGSLFFEGRVLKIPYPPQIRLNIQMIFQQPQGAFNPRWSLYRSLTEPLSLLGEPYDMDRVLTAVEGVGLYREHMGRMAGELSGGELQRAAIARIMILNPSLIILDEPTSMLDCVSQAQVMHILRQYQEELNTTYLLITHQRQLARLWCDIIYEIDGGVVSQVEHGGVKL